MNLGSESYGARLDGMWGPRLRLDTLVRLRWLAVAGQSLAVLVVGPGLGFPVPLGACLAVIALSAIANIALRLLYPVSERLEALRASVLLGFDVLQLCAMLYLTGGLENPFAILLVAPVLISATTLPPVPTAALGLLAVGCATFLVFFYLPLPWGSDPRPLLPLGYKAGLWTAIVIALIFIGAYAWRVAEEARQLQDALAATELVLAREQHLSALDGLAAAAAHELGTPLATITLVVKELERSTASAEGPLRDDVVLLREQVDRCRDILRKLTSLNNEGAPHERLTLATLIEEVVAPHRNFGIAIAIRIAGGSEPGPVARRNPGLLYGLGNLVENAVDFAAARVVIAASWTAEEVRIEIADDGPGFAPEIVARIGDPYVTKRAAERHPRENGGNGQGLGLGLFIAKTLLERSGASVAIGNAAAPETGARIALVWPREAFEGLGR